MGAVLAPLMMLLVIGCSPKSSVPKSNIHGKVTYKNAPVGGGIMTFYSENSTTTCGLNPDGTYAIQGVPLGAIKVGIETESIKEQGYKAPPNMPKEMKDKMKDEMAKQNTASGGPVYVPIPKKYANKNTTTLTCEVKDGKQELNFDLTD